MSDRDGKEAGVSGARPLVARLVPWAVVPVPLLLVAIGALWFLGVDGSFESRSLLTVLNFTLVTCTSAVIALLAGRTFVATGAPGVLFLGAGVLLMGAAFTAAPLSGMRAPNIMATVHNIGMLAAGVLSLIGSWMSTRPRAPVRTPGPAILAAYVGAVAFVAGTAYLALEGITPPFFVQGTGGTTLRQVVLASSVGVFGAAGLILALAQGNATTFRRWYALGLVLLGVGLLGVLLQQALGSPISWVGRIAQYLGSVYLLVASMTSAAEARGWVLPLEAELREERAQARLLREAKEQLTRVLEGSNDGFWDWNIQSGQLEFSDRWAEMFGYTRSELAPSLSTWQGIVHPDDREEARATQNRIARGEMDRYEVERRLRHKDGHWVWVHVRGKVAERDGDGKPTRMAGTYTDITGRKRAEDALSTSERRLSAVVEGSGDGFVDIDARSGVIFRSPRLWEIAGWPKGSLPDKPESFLGLVHPEDVGRVGARVAALLAGTVDQIDEEYRLRSSKGTWTWVQTRLRVVNWAEGGKPERVAGTVRDISRSKEVEESLRDREAKLRAFFQSPSVGITVTAAGQGFAEVNDHFCSMLGYTREELLRMHWRELTHPDDVATDVAEEGKLLSGKSDAYTRDKRYIRKDGSVLWVLLSASCARRPDRSVEYVVAIVKDITERKDAEEELAVAYRQLNRHVTNTPLALVEWDRDYRVTRYTARATEMFGWADHEVIGKRIDEVPWVPEEDWPKVRAVMNAMDAGARPNNVSLNRNVRKDGKVIHCEWYNSSLYGPDGKLVSVLSLVQDVTAKETAEVGLREREAKLQAYFNTSAVGIAVSRPGKAWVEVNDTFCSMLGYSRDELQKLTWAELTHPDDVEADVREFNRVVAGESEGYSLDKRYIRKDGSVLWVLLAVSCVRFPDRSVELLVAVVRDVTDRKTSAQAVAASEAKYRNLFDTLMDGFVVVDMDGVIRESNEVYRKMLGYSAEELAQLTYKDLTPERWHPVEARAVEQILRHGFSDVYEKEYRRKDGTIFPVELRTFLLKEGGRPVAMWAVIRDVTEARALQVKLAVAGRMAALGTLVAGVAHEINNPLAAEMADQGIALEVVREVRERLRGDSPVDRGVEGRALDGVVEALEDAQEGGARIARIVRDLALFGSPDAKRRRTHLMDILDGAMRWLPVPVARSASIQVEDGGAPDVVASAGQIEQVLVNLVTNAAKATPAGQRDTVIVRVGPGEPGMARVEVIDHGIGIEPAIRDHIFDPFFTTRPAGPERGTGLGLAICHSIASAHGGTLTFESEVGKGSTFRLELPVAPVEVVSTG